MDRNDQKASCIFGARYMLTQVEALQGEIQGALIGDDIEHVHRMRVGSRRLRNGLNLFSDCLPKNKAKAWRKSIRVITQSLGHARDLDIQIELINCCCAGILDERLQPGYNRLLLRLKQQRNLAQESVHQTLDHLQKVGALDAIGAKLTNLTAYSENVHLVTPSLYQRAFEAISTNLDEFLSYENDIHDPENITELHAMRIAGKHLRYTLEVFALLYGQALNPLIRTMKDIQDLLGEIHDNDVWILWLPEFIQQEGVCIEAYFGHRGPLKRLLPGLNHFIEDRRRVRSDQYQAFLTLWEALQDEQAWGIMREIITVPMKVEDALALLPAAPEPDEAEAGGEDDTGTG
ncbi:MAG: CHAD domain-containing protein [Porticoccaceae bacterium]|nr:CHAD domain-containing protein [Porticoccaceae bacterium]